MSCLRLERKRWWCSNSFQNWPFNEGHLCSEILYIRYILRLVYFTIWVSIAEPDGAVLHHKIYLLTLIYLVSGASNICVPKKVTRLYSIIGLVLKCWYGMGYLLMNASLGNPALIWHQINSQLVLPILNMRPTQAWNRSGKSSAEYKNRTTIVTT